jgi:hypothetical protein
MTRDEAFEIEVSALIDDELGHEEVLQVVDWLVDSPALRAFYRQARTLDRATGNQVGERRNELPEELWSRIEAATCSEKTPRRTRLTWRLALGAAAACAIVIGGWVALRSWAPSRSGDGVVQIVLESERDAMSDERFVELTAELLRADRRYHRKMEEIMVAVRRVEELTEGSSEGASDSPDSLPLRLASAQTEGGRRRPLVWD